MHKTYQLTTFGCQMNISDSERIAAVCEMMGYRPAKEGEIADLYIINTCSVRQKAEDRVLGMHHKFVELKSKKKDAKVIITGCMVKRDIRQSPQKSQEYQQSYYEELKFKMPWADFFVEINQINKLPELLNEQIETKIDEYFAVTPKYNSKFQAFVPISTGCDKFCTFCIVPFTRGKEVYRDYNQIYNEVLSLVQNDVKEITLLGQNVNSWKSRKEGLLGVPIPKFRGNIEQDYLDFADLMENLAQIDGDFWLRFTSSHPYDINPRLIDVVANEKNVAKQFHFALQSGSNSVLRRMNRYYTAEEFEEKVNLIKEKIPGVAITTDVIVGFCGETEEEFMDSVKLCERIHFDQIYISEYSQRSGTIAAKFYKDDVPHETKEKRKQILEEVLKKGLKEKNKVLINTKQKALVYKTDRKTKNLIARTTHGKDVEIINSQNKEYIGQFVYVDIKDAVEFRLFGVI